MSAGVSDQAKCPLNKLSLLQRMKGQGNQVSNGSKEPIGAAEGATGSEGFEPWRTQQQNSAAHTGYGPSVPISSATDLYNMSTAVNAKNYSSEANFSEIFKIDWFCRKGSNKKNVRWIYVKDVPNVQLRHIHLENNENKSVTNSRDAQEVPHARGLQVLRIMHSYPHSTSIFDDFIHYEKRQEEEDNRKQPVKEMGHHEGGGEGRGRGDHHRGGRNHDRDRDGDRDRNDGHRGGGHRGERSDRDGHHGGGGGGGGGHHRDRDNRSRGGRGGGRN
ncbi:hypothetical protein HUJ04_002424 [Dendroctonus ponderosae]|nr:hypothetical protein HUJ04_002424 [Dendroctonus ponderosae]